MRLGAAKRVSRCTEFALNYECPPRLALSHKLMGVPPAFALRRVGVGCLRRTSTTRCLAFPSRVSAWNPHTGFHCGHAWHQSGDLGDLACGCPRLNASPASPYPSPVQAPTTSVTCRAGHRGDAVVTSLRERRRGTGDRAGRIHSTPSRADTHR